MLRRPVCLTLLVLLVSAVGGVTGLSQTVAQLQKAQGFYAEASALHQQGKHAEAAGKMKAATALLPKNKVYRAYQAELEALTARDTADQHALRAPKDAETSVAALVAYLTASAVDDREKAQLIFRWITDRIAYDTEAYYAGKTGDNSVAGVLKNRKSVCEGYATLFEALGKEAGLEVVKIIGTCKGLGYVNGAPLKDSNHAWNAIKLDGQWHLVDSTWGAGSVSNKKFVKEYKPYYFLVSPEQLIFTHLPADPRWQLLPTPLTKEEFERRPRPEWRLFDYGVAVKDVEELARRKEFKEYPLAMPGSPAKVTIHSAPLESRLRAGTKYRFRVEAPGLQAVAVFVDGKPVALKKTDSLFEGEVVAKKGQMQLAVRPPHLKTQFFWILKYTVE